MSLLKVEGLGVTFCGEPILKNLWLTVGGNERLAIVGRNGCGKSTLLRAISGAARVDDGSRMSFCGVPMANLPMWRRSRMGLVHVLEGARVFPSLTVKQNLLIGNCASSVVAEEHLVNVLRSFTSIAGINMLQRPASSLSGGERALVAIGRAVVQRPRLVLLDSPFLGAGPRFREAIVDMINLWTSTAPVSIVLVDHDMPIIRSIADRVFEMRDGALYPV